MDLQTYRSSKTHHKYGPSLGHILFVQYNTLSVLSGDGYVLAISSHRSSLRGHLRNDDGDTFAPPNLVGWLEFPECAILS